MPVQIYESVGVFLLFLLLARLSRRGWLGDRLLLLYLALYAPFRFLLEFLRGDAYRGFLGPLSLSQALSLALLAVVCPCFWAGEKPNEFKNAPAVCRRLGRWLFCGSLEQAVKVLVFQPGSEPIDPLPPPLGATGAPPPKAAVPDLGRRPGCSGCGRSNNPGW